MKIVNDIGFLLIGISGGIFIAMVVNPPVDKFPLFLIAVIVGIVGIFMRTVYRSFEKKTDWFGTDKTRINFPN